MSFWEIDLTTRVGAESAADQGAIGCYAFAGFAVIGMVVFGGIAGYQTAEGLAMIAVTGVEAVIGVIAGLRMRKGKGAFLGMAVAALLLLEMLFKIVTLSGLPGLVINAVILVVIVNGVRGALALRGDTEFEDDQAAVFE